MVDILKCRHEARPKREECCRYTAEDSKWQNYVDFREDCNEKVCYKYYVKNNLYKPKNRKD